MNRKLAISIGIIALLGAYIYFSKTERTSRVPDPGSWETAADEIIISSPEKTITFVKKEGTWLINRERFPADSRAVDDLEKKVRDMDIIDLVSNKGFYSRYDLTPEKARSVTVRGKGSDLRRIIFGKKGSTSRHTYVRVNDDPGVYLAAGNFDSLLERGVDDFRNREICKIDPKTVKGLSIIYRGRAYNFSRQAAKKNLEKPGKDTTIKDEKNGAQEIGSAEKEIRPRWISREFSTVNIDSGKVESRLSVFNPLQAADYPAIQKDFLRSPVSRITLTCNDREVVLNIFKKNRENRYLATSSESPYVFTIDEWKARRFFIEGVPDFKAEKRENR